jgi:hypothetical protein
MKSYKLDLGWLDSHGRRRLAAALVAHRSRMAASPWREHLALVDTVIEALDTDAKSVSIGPWQALEDGSRPDLEGTINTLEKAAVAHADWAQFDDGGAIALRELREHLINATGWAPKEQPRRFGEPATAGAR